MKLAFKKIYPEAKVPTYAHTADAGMDLYSGEDVIIAAGARALIPTGIAVAIPVGYVGLLWDKSGLSNKHGLKVLGGVIDAGYRGEIFVGLLNTGSEAYTITLGAKVAQMLIQPVVQPELVEVLDLDETERGAGGFGSSGIS